MAAFRKEGESRAQAAERLKIHMLANANVTIYKDRNGEPVTIWVLILEIVEGFIAFFNNKKYDEKTGEFRKRTLVERIFNKDVFEAFISIGKLVWKAKTFFKP